MRAGLAAVAVGLALAACGGSSHHATIAATPRVALIDVAPRIRVSGADAGAVVRASTVDVDGKRWTSTTRVADLRRDPSRPLWTLHRGTDFFTSSRAGFDVRLDLVEDGRTVARTTIRRRWRTAGVRVLSAGGGLYGELNLPSGPGRRAAALVIGGSEGGLSTAGTAELLASHGYPTLALAYFREPGLPQELRDIPLEYFARALRRLRALPDVDPRRVVVIGTSRGGEGALLIGATYPRLVHGVVALVPSNVVNPSSPGGRGPAWTLHGKPLPRVGLGELGNPLPPDYPRAVIPAERISGPILTASGGKDRLWPSSAYTTILHERLDQRHFAYAHRDVEFGEAGHLLGTAVPNMPTPSTPRYGGSAKADEAARAAMWPRILDFMRGLRGD